MNYKVFKNKFKDFLKKYEDVVLVYEENHEPIIDQEKVIYNIFVLKNITDFNVLLECIINSLNNNTDIIKELNSTTWNKYKESNIIKTYFDEINKIYESNDNNYDIEFCEDNRNKLIEMNLKTVISIAKKYQGLGLSLPELISAGNLGLCIAYDKFKPTDNKLRKEIIESIDKLYGELECQDGNIIKELLSQKIKYGKLFNNLNAHFKDDKSYIKEKVVKWINNNLKEVKFSSVAAMWIRAYILIELNNNSRIIRKPVIENTEDNYRREYYVSLSDNISDDNDTKIEEVLNIESNDKNEQEIKESYMIFKENLSKLLTGISTRDKIVVFKKFGIGLPRPMLPKEIAEQEDLSIARISQILQSAFIKMKENAVKYNIDGEMMYNIVKNIF